MTHPDQELPRRHDDNDEHNARQDIHSRPAQEPSQRWLDLRGDGLERRLLWHARTGQDRRNRRWPALSQLLHAPWRWHSQAGNQVGPTRTDLIEGDTVTIHLSERLA